MKYICGRAIIKDNNKLCGCVAQVCLCSHEYCMAEETSCCIVFLLVAFWHCYIVSPGLHCLRRQERVKWGTMYSDKLQTIDSDNVTAAGCESEWEYECGWWVSVNMGVSEGVYSWSGCECEGWCWRDQVILRWGAWVLCVSVSGCGCRCRRSLLLISFDTL